MDQRQEEAVYDFLENVTEPFQLEQVSSYAQTQASKRNSRLTVEIAALFDSRKIAFRLDEKRWLSRRGYFETATFVISPTKLELLNGILIPGHRCIPFANPALLPNEYTFYWEGGLQVPLTTTEGPPEDFYPFYFIFGEEYIPQYIGRENLENEASFLDNPYEEPAEVSIRTLDMRNIYRELGFVPGDRFAVQTLDWKEGRFSLKKISKDDWAQKDLDEWLACAEKAFSDSFAMLGSGANTEEQITFAYWYGGRRIMETPAYSLEEFLFIKTKKIETVPYGIETRFWFSGMEIPDSKGLIGFAAPYDKTVIEDILIANNIPVSEFVIHAYVLDALFRGENDVDDVMNRLVPPVIRLKKAEFSLIAGYIIDSMEEIKQDYSLFLDKKTGPVRLRLAELHTAVIELAAKLQKEEVEASWLPKHTFIVLSQLQGHVASLLEDLALEDAPPDAELEAIDDSLDAMIETYSDVKEMIEGSLDNFRRNNLRVIHGRKKHFSASDTWRLLQISISGINAWRQALVQESCTMAELHAIIQAGMGWQAQGEYRFRCESPGSREAQFLHDKMQLGDVLSFGLNEIVYEYNGRWSVKVIIMAAQSAIKNKAVGFIAGAGASPPESVGGAVRFCRLLEMLENGSDAEKRAAAGELGDGFVPGFFDMEKCNEKVAQGLRKGEGDGVF
ncbi:MAG: plasmid pRiA4b ORF-3 family protein [Spirochaetes bacterium]|nr:plasmid pRiA4b ORF-3 family protein [Spirochaetota bacterium]